MKESIKNQKINERKHREVYIVLLLLLCISVGFSYLSAQLDIFGNTTVRKQSWSVHFGTPTVSSTDIITGTADRLVSGRGSIVAAETDTTKVTFTADLEYPGDYFEFTVPVINDGTIDAMITNDSGVTKTISPEKNYIDYTVNYVTSVPFQPKGRDGLHHGKTVLVKVRVEYNRNTVENSDVNSMAAGGISLTSTFSMKYIQADNTATYYNFETANS